jgi:hypothetical protein
VENRLHALKFLRYGFGSAADPGGGEIDTLR